MVRFVFVSSPYGADTGEGMAENARVAAQICKWVVDNNPEEIPIAPHIICSQWWGDGSDREKAISFCKMIMPLCSKIYQLNGCMSSGMYEERKLAIELGLEKGYVSLRDLPDLDGADLRLVPNGLKISALSPGGFNAEI